MCFIPTFQALSIMIFVTEAVLEDLQEVAFCAVFQVAIHLYTTVIKINSYACAFVLIEIQFLWSKTSKSTILLTQPNIKQLQQHKS